jgi:hypothetical protein
MISDIIKDLLIDIPLFFLSSENRRNLKKRSFFVRLVYTVLFLLTLAFIVTFFGRILIQLLS